MPPLSKKSTHHRLNRQQSSVKSRHSHHVLYLNSKRSISTKCRPKKPLNHSKKSSRHFNAPSLRYFPTIPARSTISHLIGTQNRSVQPFHPSKPINCAPQQISHSSAVINRSYSSSHLPQSIIQSINAINFLPPKQPQKTWSPSRQHIFSQSKRVMASKHEEVGVTPPTEQEDTIFGKMTRGEIPVPTVYEDEKCIVINDLYPQAKVHMLVIPRKPISQISKAEHTQDDQELLGHLLLTAQKAAKIANIEDYRLVINNGKDACQSVYHLHVHILGGEQLTGNFA